MLSIFLSEELEDLARQSHSTVFLEYFCDNRDDRRNSAVAILRGLLHQLLGSRPNLYKYIMAEYQNQGEQLFSSFPSLWNIFRDMVQDPDLKTVYCVLDGLDECDEDSLEWFLLKLKSLFLTDSGPNTVCHLRMIIASRDLPGFLTEVLQSFPRITLDRDADAEINHDIHRFTEDKINEISKLKRYPDQLCVHVKDVFKKRAQGTFLWIGIAAQKLRECIVTEVEEALKSLPSGLEPLFARMLLQIKPERRQTIATILRWVVLAVRPLTVSELSIAIKQPDHDRDNDNVVAFTQEEVTRDQILNCGFLLRITEDTVDLVHQSVKDYLLRKTSDSNAELEAFRIKEDKGNLELARKCFYYLQDVALVGEPAVEDPKTFRMSPARREGLLEEFLLLRYAMQYWPMHARALNNKDGIFDVSQPFYQDPKFCAIWRKMYIILERRRMPFDLLHIAIFFNLKLLTENVISTYGLMKNEKSSGAKDQRNKQDEDGSTALHLAAKHGFEAVSQVLLDNEACVDARDRYEETALHVAAHGGHLAVARLLLDKGASTEAKTPGRETPLHYAALGEHSVVGLLLDRGASIEAETSSGETPLHYAAAFDHSKVVKLLLDRGASIQAENASGETPLHYAAWGKHSNVVKLLLDRGACVEAENKRGIRPLHNAASLGLPAMAQLLLEHKADVTAKDKDGNTPMHFAAESGNEGLVQLLLNRKAFKEARNRLRKTPLHVAVQHDCSDAVEVLLLHKASVRSRDCDGWTALHYAARSSAKAIVELLLNSGADLEVKCKKGKTALHMAAERGRMKILLVLLDQGALIDAQDTSGCTAVHYAAKNSRTLTLRHLLLRGASREIRNRDGLTALQQAKIDNDLAVVRLIEKFGNNIDTKVKTDRRKKESYR